MVVETGQCLTKYCSIYYKSFWRKGDCNWWQ